VTILWNKLNNEFKVPVKSKLSMCSEFVTPQKIVLLATQPNLNDKEKPAST